MNKWFRDDAIRELSKIRRAIRNENQLWCRRFYWTSLAETVRLTSNARTTTFKLHIRPEEELKSRSLSPINLFTTLLQSNLNSLYHQKKLLQEKGLLSKGQYKGNIDIRLADSSIKNKETANAHDLLITSPPYGDNKTTVSYGQHAYLPLQWIDLKDVDNNLDETWLTTAYEIDNRSLGGKLKSAIEDITELLDISKSLRCTMQNLKNEPQDRRLRVAAFWRDLNRCIEPALAALKLDAYMIWTVGNRSIAGRPIPMNRIMIELFTARGVMFVEQIQRTIPSKRMAIKNNISTTMRTEKILIMRKCSLKG